MSLPVSQYEALLAEVRGLRRKAQRVQQLATPLLAHCSTDVNTTIPHIQQNDEVKRSYKMDSLLAGREHNGSSTNYDGGATSSTDGDANYSEDEYISGRRSTTQMSVSSEPIIGSLLYHSTWPDRTMWHSEPTTHPLAPSTNMEVTSVMSFASSSGGVLLGGSPSLSRRSSQQLEAKVDMVYSLLAMLSGQEHADMGETLLALSTNPESCFAMRQSGCIPLLVQMVQSDKDPEARKKASLALHNLVHSQSDEKLRKREIRIFKLLEQTRSYTEALKAHREFELEVTSSNSEDDDKHPVQTIAHLMKLSFDELHRQAICSLGGIHAIANLVEAEHVNHGSTVDNQHCTLLRRYACMALTNLTFGDSGNKALLCSFREFMRALVVQLQSSSDELRQVTASVLRNLSWRADSSSKEILREVGSVSGLMKAAMLDNKENTLKSILSALWNLSAHCTENKSEICSVEGALGFLVDMLTYKAASKSLAIIENSGGILRNISSQIAVRDDYREILRQHNCLQILLDQLKSPSLTIVSNACGTLWNLSAKCAIDQETLWQMGAPSMLRSLNHSKHKMIAMGSSAALKNLLSAKPSQTVPSVIDSTALSLDLPVLPTLGARKQKALLQDLDQTLSETYENIERDSPIKTNDNFIKKLDSPDYESEFSSLTIGEPSTSYDTKQNYSLPYFDNSNDLNKNFFVKKRDDNRSFNVYTDSGLQVDLAGSSSSIDNDKCKTRELKLKEISVYSDEKDHCSLEDVSDSDNQSLNWETKLSDDLSFSGLTARKEVAALSPVSTLPQPIKSTPTNVTLYEGNIDEIDMNDISIHFPEEEKTDLEKTSKTANRSGIPLPRSTKSNIARLSSALPRRNLQTSTPIRLSNTIGSNEVSKVQNIDKILLEDETSKEFLSPIDSNAAPPSNSSPEMDQQDLPPYLAPELVNFNLKERDRLLERSCEENNPVDNRMLDPDAMIESLDRFTAELVSQASHLQSNGDEKFKDNTWNEDTSPNEVTFPSISGSAPNVITFGSNESSAPEISEEKKESNDFSSINTSTMTQSTLIAIEATKMATVFQNEAAMSLSLSSVTSLELDKVQPPSLLESMSLDITRSPKLTTRKKSLKGLMVRRALSNSLNHGSSLESLENNSLTNLDLVNPPSVMAELLDMDGSTNSVASLPSENQELKTDFVINGSVTKTNSFLNSKLTNLINLNSVTDLENINPPSLFNEITDLCNSLADVATEAIGSETELFEDCQTHVLQTEDEITEFSDANSATPIQSDISSPEVSPKKIKSIAKPMTLKQKRNAARDRYKTYTIAAEMLTRCDDSVTDDFQTVNCSTSEDYHSIIDTNTYTKSKSKETRSEEARAEMSKDVPAAPSGSPRSKLSIRRNFLQKRLENRDRFKTQTITTPIILNSPEPDLHSMVQREADLVLKSLRETKTTTDELLDCETLSLVSNDDDSEQNSGSTNIYRTFHKSWSLNKNIPVIDPLHSQCAESPPVSPKHKPKIIKPPDEAPEEEEEEVPKAIRGRRKPLYTKTPKIAPKTSLKPIKNMTSNLVKNVTSSLKQTKSKPVPAPSRASSGYGTRSNSPKTSTSKPKLERQGTFTKDEATSALRSRIPTPGVSKIPSKTRPVASASSERLNKPKMSYTRSTSADSGKKAVPAVQKRASLPSPSNPTTARKQVTSKIASLWKKIEETKKQPPKKDTRVWIGNQEDNKSGVVMREKNKSEDVGKRVSRLGSFIVMDEEVQN